MNKETALFVLITELQLQDFIDKILNNNKEKESILEEFNKKCIEHGFKDWKHFFKIVHKHLIENN